VVSEAKIFTFKKSGQFCYILPNLTGITGMTLKSTGLKQGENQEKTSIHPEGHSPEIRSLSEGLYFSDFFFVFGVSRCVGLGEPSTFRAAALTAVEARKTRFFFRGIFGRLNMG
jgi:hypothetical protein